MTIPERTKIYPRTGDTQTVYLKNVIHAENIEIGDYTIYNDFVHDPCEFQKNNVLYHYPINQDKLTIGRFCSIACGAKFLFTSANHSLKSLSTYTFPIFFEEWGLPVSEITRAWDNRGDIVIGNDVWIGYEAVILSGVTIGDGAIIGARAVVTKDVPPYTIVGGIPAKQIRRRFADEEIESLLALKWWNWKEEVISANVRNIQSGNIEALKEAGTAAIVEQKELFNIGNIPAILWGEPADKVILAVHGNLSHKADIPIQILAEYALCHGYQVLSFDLPEHGDRKREGTLCKVQNCVEELHTVMAYAKSRWKQISLFANSIGAYFSLLAFHNEELEKVWFLSPVVNMQRIIENMMMWFSVSEERLKQEQTIQTPIGQMLYWDYYCYVKEHPIGTWQASTAILYGSEDELCETDTILKFANDFSCNLKIAEGAEHYFHTSEQLRIMKAWLLES